MFEQIELGIATTLICMSIVFLVLIGLSYVIRIQRSIVEKIEGAKEVKKAPSIQKPAEPVRLAAEKAEEDNEELVAAISAAVAVVLGRPASSIIVKSIKRLDSAAPSWAVAGRQDQIGSRF